MEGPAVVDAGSEGAGGTVMEGSAAGDAGSEGTGGAVMEGSAVIVAGSEGAEGPVTKSPEVFPVWPTTGKILNLKVALALSSAPKAAGSCCIQNGRAKA